MLHARLFSETPKFRDNHFQPLRSSLESATATYNSSKVYLDGNPAIDRPLFVQFCANKPEDLLEAARYVAPFCDAVDLNLGCPQGIARKGHYGAFLQEDQELIYSLINTLHRCLDVPVTAKIRILDTKEATLRYAKTVLAAGASILTVHGRTRDMKGHKTGLADWKMIRYLRDQLGKDVVLFANGNILRKEDVDRCLEITGADGVMSAEGNLYDPGIFADDPLAGEEGREFWRGNDGKGGWRMDAIFRRYMDILYKYVLEQHIPPRQPLYLSTDKETISNQDSQPLPDLPQVSSTNTNNKRPASPPPPQPQAKKRRTQKDKTSSPNLLAMQPHLFHLLRPLVAKHHHIRDALARCRAGDIAAFENVLQMVEQVCADGIREYLATDGQSWEKEMREDEERQRLKEEERLRSIAAEAALRNGDGNCGGAKAGVGKANEGNSEVVEDEMDESSVETVKACKRPWWIVQPYVRPLPKEALAKGSITLSRKQMEKERAGMKDAGVTGGYTQTQQVGHENVEKRQGMEQVEVPRDGLVCG